MKLLRQYQIDILKRVLEQCDDEELVKLLGRDVMKMMETLGDRLDELMRTDRRFRAPGEYSNHTPYGIADEVRREENKK